MYKDSQLVLVKENVLKTKSSFINAFIGNWNKSEII